MRHRLIRELRRQRSDDAGALAPEALIILVALVWTYTAMFVFWDAFKTENLVVKSAQTVADMVSREPIPIDEEFIDGANSVFAFLAGADADNNLRVSVVTMVMGADGETPELELVWSHGTGGWPDITDLAEIEDRLPILALGDELIVVEGTIRWEPLFNVGLPGRNLYEIVVAKRRIPGKVLCRGAVCT